MEVLGQYFASKRFWLVVAGFFATIAGEWGVPEEVVSYLITGLSGLFLSFSAQDVAASFGGHK